MIGMIAFLAASAASSPASGVTYLSCTTTLPGSPPTQWSFALHENEGVVDVSSTANGGRADGRKPASFTADAVQFMGFTLSRVNLTLSREDDFGGMSLGTESGQCHVVPAPSRAF